MKKTYEAPVLNELGSLEHLTRQFNKVGQSSDIYSQLVPVIGSLVPPSN